MLFGLTKVYNDFEEYFPQNCFLLSRMSQVQIIGMKGSMEEYYFNFCLISSLENLGHTLQYIINVDIQVTYIY